MGLWRNGHNMWILQRKNVDQITISKVEEQQPTIFFCCENGKILLPNLLATLQKLEVLLTSKKSSAIKFWDQICMYNSVLAFTSFGAKVDESVTGGPRPYSFRIQGELHHKIKSPCPVEGQQPQFTQLYIHDTKREH
jgi:hypothetical protein